MTTQIHPALQATVERAAARFAAGGLDAAEVTAVALIEPVGRPFIAKFGVLAGQQAQKVRHSPVIVAVAHRNAAAGELVWRFSLSSATERTLAVTDLQALQERNKAVLGDCPVVAFDAYGDVTTEMRGWLRENVKAIKERAGVTA